MAKPFQAAGKAMRETIANAADGGGENPVIAAAVAVAVSPIAGAVAFCKALRGKPKQQEAGKPE